MNTRQLMEGAGRYQTPMYVFDLDELHRTVYRLRSVFRNQALLCYAMKANSYLTGEMAEQMDRIEVCSMGEYRICRAQGIPPRKLLISGVLKKEEELEEILEDLGATCMYTAESCVQYQLLAAWSSRHERKLPVFLRLTSGNQFGMDLDTVCQIIEDRHRYPWIEIRGIHYFSGTQKKVKKICEELEMLSKLKSRLREEQGFVVEELEYGPGFAVPYFEGQKDHRMEEYEEVAAMIRELGLGGAITLEMGRACAADCGYYLTRIRERKVNASSRYCIVDGGIHQMNYDGQIRGMYQPMVFLKTDPAKQSECASMLTYEHAGQTPEETGVPQEKPWTICGSLCTVNDVLVTKLLLEDPRPGDILIFARVGAYSAMEGMALFLSHELPAVAIYSEAKGWTLARKQQETYLYNMIMPGSKGHTFRACTKKDDFGTRKT